ncbi:unnamed protein product [Peniophora sp. CBMAI 1063]|nr:unnamed protein product [Peniophora sp. CBMAI 1063]
MSELPTIQDRLDDLELQLCDAQIAVELATANNEPLAVQELATLRADRVELQIQQETARASNQLQKSDITHQELELALLTQRIECATLAVNGASEAETRLADLQLKRSALLLSQCKKHALHRSASTAATTSSSDPMRSPSRDSAPAPAPDALSKLSSGLSPPDHLRLSSLLRASLPRGPSPHASSPCSVLSSPEVLSDKPVVPDGRPSPTVAVDNGDQDAHDTGDVERELIGEDARQDASVAREAPSPRKGSAAIIDIDDAGVARDLTPPHGRSHRKTPDALPHADFGDDAPFMFVGSPRAPRTVLEARANKSSSPLKALIKERMSKSASPQRASINARANNSVSPLKAPPKSDAKTHKAVASARKSGGYKEPTGHPQRWMFRTLNFGAAALRTSSDWPDRVCHEVGALWAAVLSWEIRNEFKDGTAKAPAQSSLMGNIVSKSRFGPNFHDVIKKEPDFSVNVARCIHSLRRSTLAEVVKMHGTHGLAAVARALLEAYNGDESFGVFFIPLARELTTVLDIASAVPPARTDDNDSDSDNNNIEDQGVNLTGTILEALNARDGYDATPATRALQALVALEGNEKKRDASHLDTEAGPSKRARRSPDE